MVFSHLAIKRKNPTSFRYSSIPFRARGSSSMMRQWRVIFPITILSPADLADLRRGNSNLFPVDLPAPMHPWSDEALAKSDHADFRRADVSNRFCVNLRDLRETMPRFCGR